MVEDRVQMTCFNRLTCTDKFPTPAVPTNRLIEKVITWGAIAPLPPPPPLANAFVPYSLPHWRLYTIHA